MVLDVDIDVVIVEYCEFVEGILIDGYWMGSGGVEGGGIVEFGDVLLRIFEILEGFLDNFEMWLGFVLLVEFYLLYWEWLVFLLIKLLGFVRWFIEIFLRVVVCREVLIVSFRVVFFDNFVGFLIFWEVGLWVVVGEVFVGCCVWGWVIEWVSVVNFWRIVCGVLGYLFGVGVICIKRNWKL